MRSRCRCRGGAHTVSGQGAARRQGCRCREEGRREIVPASSYKETPHGALAASGASGHRTGSRLRGGHLRIARARGECGGIAASVGSYGLTFSVWTGETGGTRPWKSTHTSGRWGCALAFASQTPEPVGREGAAGRPSGVLVRGPSYPSHPRPSLSLAGRIHRRSRLPSSALQSHRTPAVHRDAHSDAGPLEQGGPMGFSFPSQSAPHGPR